MADRYSHLDLLAFAERLLIAAGLPEDRARVVAEMLLEGDLLGHTTHGLQMLGPYLKKIQAGEMTLQGEPDVLKETGSSRLLDGKYLPGPWLVVEAIRRGRELLADHPVATVVIRRSHHIGCLQAYLKKATDQGLFLLLMCSDPSVQTVSPPGGLKGIYTPNPIAAGIPTQGDPILIDISTSTTSNGLCMRLHKKQERLPHAWLKTPEGTATDDPATLFGEPAGTLMPLGGMDLGYKGFAFAILIEALTSALGGHGRADQPSRWGASVFLQLINPEAFGGLAAFQRETSHLVKACQETPVRPGDPPVRMPGQKGLQRRRQQLAHGVELYPGIMDSLRAHAEKYEIEAPGPLQA